MRRAALLLVALAGCSRSSAASRVVPDEDAAAVATLQRDEQSSHGAADVVRSLTDEVGPRLAGSDGDRAAVAWALRAMNAAGLANVRAEAVKVPRWERGEESAEVVAPTRHRLAVAALGGSVGTPEGGVEGEVVVARSLEELDRLDEAAVRGKIVLVDVPTERRRDGKGYGTSVVVRAKTASKAAKLGAIAALVRSIGTDAARLAHTGALHYEDGVAKIPSAALSTPDAELVARLVESGAKVRLRLVLGAKTLPDADSANVVGEIVGTEAPKEIVLVGAHLDSWDLGEGAIDDGAGCGIVLETAKLLARSPSKPRRTVRFVLFANEENGLAGGKGYAAAHAAELDAHVLAVEADLGAGRAWGVRAAFGPEAHGAFAELERLLAPLGIEPVDGPAHGGADVSPLRAAGVPVVDVAQDATSYFDFHHTASDTFDKIDAKDLAHATAAYATVALFASRARSAFGRIPEAERGHR